MTEEQFWDIIERSKQGALDCRSQTHQLEQILGELAPAQIIAFDRLFFLKRLEAYRWDLWGVAHLICDGCTDDSFDDFRRWLIGQGRQVFESVLQEPETILDLLASKGNMKWIKANPTAYVFCESLPYASDDAYETVTGEEMPPLDIESIIDRFPRYPIGERWDEDDLPTAFPSVAELFRCDSTGEKASQREL